MENDLYFCLIEPDSWKSVTQTGNFIPDSFGESGFINCYLSNDVETVANTTYTDETTELLLVVIDPFRIQKKKKKE
ncbi:MAG: DUF952 domain-containing protein, partial [Balneolales bacterium]|nr:DUF952 domain-containing protein [Balneolales bacterium]